MFTGIIQSVGKLQQQRNILEIEVLNNFFDMAIGDSIAVDGICLTVKEIFKNKFTVDVSEETLKKTTLGLKSNLNQIVNLEPALRISDRLGGHIVSGHIDGLGIIENIEKYKDEGDFTNYEKIEHLSSLTGAFPISLVIDDEVMNRLSDLHIPPISEFDVDLGAAWFIPRKVNIKRTKNGKEYYILEVIDSNNVLTTIKCWGVNSKKDKIAVNRPYMGRLEYDEQWGFSTRSISRNFRLLG